MIKSKNVPSYLKNYLELEDNINLEQIKILDILFSKVDKYEINSSNVIYESNIEDGIKLVKKDKEKQKIMDEETLKELLLFVDKQINNNKNNTDKISFYKSFTNLIKNSEFINSKEQIVLNFLFDKLNYFDKELVMSEDNKFAIKRKSKKK